MRTQIGATVIVGVATGLFVSACDRDMPATERQEAAPEAVVDRLEHTESSGAVKEIRSYLELEALFNELNYTPEAWMAGIREVPRLYISEIPERWSKHTVKEIDVLTKKRLFFRTLGPLVLRSNELILQDRERLQKVAASIENGEALHPEDRAWLDELGQSYRIETAKFENVGDLVAELKLRVDIIPVSLALSQAAEESGWGTSRFAFSGNALFGQWTWGDGIAPDAQRSGKGDYKIAAFETPLKSVQAHARNLNTHSAYRDFRRERASLRRAGKVVRGQILVGNLQRYSERGGAYVKTLETIMRVNQLNEADDAFLVTMKPVMLVPAGE